MDNWMLIAVALTSASMLAWPTLASGGGGARALTASAAVQMMNREKAVVVDVCEDAEYAAGHVVGARHAPLSQLEQKLPGLVKNKATPVIEKVHSLTGGMRAWREANLPIEKA